MDPNIRHKNLRPHVCSVVQKQFTMFSSMILFPRDFQQEALNSRFKIRLRTAQVTLSRFNYHLRTTRMVPRAENTNN